MRIITLLLLSNLMQTVLSAQSPKYKDDMVVWATEVNLRETPSLDARVLARITNGELVRTYNPEGTVHYLDQINGINGTWVQVEYKGLAGYVFSTYIGPGFQHFYEDAHITYFPTVKNWYGIYYDSISGKEFIRKVVVKAVKTIYEGDPKEHLVLQTNQAAKSLFLIATNTDMPDREIGLFTKHVQHNNKDLRPGDSRTIFCKLNRNTVTGTYYTIFATGIYALVNNSVGLSDYVVWLADRNFDSTQPGILQNLSKELNLEGICEMLYFGDIDNDEKPDILLRQCGNSCREILFLSSLTREGEILRPVSIYIGIDEC